MKNSIKIYKFVILVIIIINSIFLTNIYADDSIITIDLSDEVDGEKVIATYNAVEKSIVISGKGLIKEDNWKELARTIEGGERKSFTKYYNSIYKAVVPKGWNISNDINMTFESSAQVKLSEAGFKGTGFGWFQDFKGSIKFNDSLDTENLTDMSNMFERAYNFSDDSVTRWNTSNVRNMYRMFDSTRKFKYDLNTNEELGYWDVSKVKTMLAMFRWSNFDGHLDGWNTKSCIDMSAMFEGTPFNSEVNHFDVRNVDTMDYMFLSAKNFNKSISNWETRSLKSCSYMFRRAVSFNQDISTLDLSKVVTIRQMFELNTGIKNIVLNRKNAVNLARTTDIFKNSDPDYIKFDKLKAFSWVPADKYLLKKGDPVEEEKIVERDVRIDFEEDSKYELRRFKGPIDVGLSASEIQKTYDGIAITEEAIKTGIQKELDVNGTLSVNLDNLELINSGIYTVRCRFEPDKPEIYQTGEVSVKVSVLKAEPTFTVPEYFTAKSNETLEDVDISGCTGDGTWKFEDDLKTSVGKAGRNNFTMVFTPNDLVNYKSKEISVDIDVEQVFVGDDVVPQIIKETPPIISEIKPVIDKENMGFDDLTNTVKLNDAVEFSFVRGIFKGVSENEFRPEINVNYAMLSTILYRMAGKPEIHNIRNDWQVPQGVWYEKAMIWNLEEGIIGKRFFEEGIFEKEISRKDLEKSFNSYLVYAGKSDRYAKKVTDEFIKDESLLNSKNDASSIRRGDFAIIIKNFIQKLIDMN